MADEENDEHEPRRPTVERKGLVVHINGAATLLVEAPMSTRPQDWAPAARDLLFERRRAR